MLLKLTILPGDGIGPEVTEQAVLVLQAVADGFGHQLQLQTKLIGGAALAATNDPLPAGYGARLAWLRRPCCWARWEVRRSITIRDICGRRQDCCAYGASWGRMPICGRRYFFRRWRIVLRCARKWCAGPTS